MNNDYSYYRLHLKKYLTDECDVRANDTEFINAREDLAAAEFERVRRGGSTVDQAQEIAMVCLMEGL